MRPTRARHAPRCACDAPRQRRWCARSKRGSVIEQPEAARRTAGDCGQRRGERALVAIKAERYPDGHATRNCCGSGRDVLAVQGPRLPGLANQPVPSAQQCSLAGDSSQMRRGIVGGIDSDELRESQYWRAFPKIVRMPLPAPVRSRGDHRIASGWDHRTVPVNDRGKPLLLLFRNADARSTALRAASAPRSCSSMRKCTSARLRYAIKFHASNGFGRRTP